MGGNYNNLLNSYIYIIKCYDNDIDQFQKLVQC